jgi:DNA polymerase family A
MLNEQVETIRKRSTTAWQLAGTKTFRLGSRQLFGDYGDNLQNPSPTKCKIYIPDEGKIFIQADQAGAEALIVSYLCDKGAFRNLFTYSIKPHVYVALHLFATHWIKAYPFTKHALTLGIQELSIAPDWKPLAKEIKNHDKYYAIGKMVCHASNYDLTPPTFQMHVLQRSEGKIILTLREAEEFIQKYHNLFPEIREWHSKTRSMLLESRYLRNLFDFPRYFGTHLNNNKALKEAYAFVPQSTVGTITNIAYTQLQAFVEEAGLDWDLLVNKHDSILLQTPVEESMLAREVLQAALEIDLIGWDGTPFKMKTEVATGYNWGKYDKDTNPCGLKEISA